MIEWLKKTDIPLTTISKKTNISRKTLYNWLNGGVIRQKSYQKIYDTYKEEINLINTNIILTKGSGMDAQYIIDLQKDNIEMIKQIQILKEKLKSRIKHKPAYHFKMVSTYKVDTDEWLDTDIFGDFSMTGYTYDEIVPIMNEENDNNSWIDRYHPDSKKRLCKQTLKDIKTDYHYLKWEHMMWKAKDGQYKCYNIDLVYVRAEEKVTSMFYWVNGDKD